MTDPDTAPALATALAYHHAWTGNNLGQAMAYIADDITCDAPGTRISAAQQYRDFLGGFMTQLTGVQTVAACGDESTRCAVLLPAHRQRQRRTYRRVLHRHRREDHPQRARL